MAKGVLQVGVAKGERMVDVGGLWAEGEWEKVEGCDFLDSVAEGEL